MRFDWTVVMSFVPIPFNEDRRIRELQKLRSKEWGVSAALNELCAVASMTLGTPIAYVSLIHESEQFFCGKFGLDAERTSRETAFCSHTIMAAAPLIIENASEDPRFAENSLVTGPLGIRAYIGIPLEAAPDVCVGAFCIMDTRPRTFDAGDIATLKFLAKIAMSIIDGNRVTLELNDQLQGAIDFQKDMLPDEERILQIRARVPLDIASHYKPLEGIGGDIWNVEATSSHRVMLYIADFTGHGVQAALNTARFHSFVHLISQRTDEPASVLNRLNKRLHEVLPDGQFATMFCATIDFTSGRMDYASAGAPPMIYRKSGSDPFETLCDPSLPLGIVGDSTYVTRTVPFLQGGFLVLFTDGLIETPKPPDAVFTVDALMDFVASNDGASSQEISDRILERLLLEARGQADDDIALVVARRTDGVFETVADYQI